MDSSSGLRMHSETDIREQLILVTEDDATLAPAGKLETHRSGALHRAFSVFLFRPNGALLLQKRAPVKYHSAGKWANTCCGHPRPGEDVLSAAERRLTEETGITASLEEGFKARYRADLDNGMIENELVHVVFGISGVEGRLNPEEVSDYRNIGLEALGEDIANRPETYAVWLVKYFERHAEQIAHHRDLVLSRC
ncbi:MAG: isopentenyl-diphosphate Delta-isomerase [Pseudomonadota bacterium]